VHQYLFLAHRFNVASVLQSDDSQVSKLSHAIKTIAERIGNLPEVIELEYFSSANFIGLFVTESFAPLLKQITADFAEEVKKSGVFSLFNLYCYHTTLIHASI
jgi:hypothetical protein